MDGDLGLPGKIAVSVLVFLGLILLLPLLILFVILFYVTALLQGFAALFGRVIPVPTLPNLYPSPHHTLKESQEARVSDTPKPS